MLTPGQVIHHFKIWQIFTSMFMFSPDPRHIAFGLMLLYIFGPRVERDKGSAWFIRFYLLAGLVANILAVIFRPLMGGLDVPAAGGSGPTLAVLGAFCLLYHLQFFWIFWMIPVRVLYIYYAMLAFQGAFIVAEGARGMPDYFAGLGGLLAAWAFLKSPWLRMGSVDGNKTPHTPRVPRTVKGKRTPPSTSGKSHDFLEV